jgi:hypothetical protein
LSIRPIITVNFSLCHCQVILSSSSIHQLVNPPVVIINVILNLVLLSIRSFVMIDSGCHCGFVLLSASIHPVVIINSLPSSLSILFR